MQKLWIDKLVLQLHNRTLESDIPQLSMVVSIIFKRTVTKVIV